MEAVTKDVGETIKKRLKRDKAFAAEAIYQIMRDVVKLEKMLADRVVMLEKRIAELRKEIEVALPEPEEGPLGGK